MVSMKMLGTKERSASTPSTREPRDWPSMVKWG